jgi:hypothetical protein
MRISVRSKILSPIRSSLTGISFCDNFLDSISGLEGTQEQILLGNRISDLLSRKSNLCVRGRRQKCLSEFTSQVAPPISPTP